MICFHHNDADGRCSGAIVHRYFQKHPEVFEYSQALYVEVDYRQDSVLPENVVVRPDEFVFIVDFHFKPNVIEQIFKDTKNIVWIDHHETAAKYEEQYPQKLEGLRDYGNKFAGCELTWNHLFAYEPMPMAVQLVSDRDIWAWKLKDTAEFNEGLKLYPHQPEDRIWFSLLDENDCILKGDPPREEKVEDELIMLGKTCLQYRDMILEDYNQSWGYEVEFEGYKCFVLDLYITGSEKFGSRLDEYDMCIGTVFSNGLWTIGLYSKEIDVSKIAVKYGEKYGISGGGHKHAAGFVAPELPFGKVNWMIDSAKRMFELLTRAQDVLQGKKSDEQLLDEIVVERNKWWSWQKNEIVSKHRKE